MRNFEKLEFSIQTSESTEIHFTQFSFLVSQNRFQSILGDFLGPIKIDFSSISFWKKKLINQLKSTIGLSQSPNHSSWEPAKPFLGTFPMKNV